MIDADKLRFTKATAKAAKKFSFLFSYHGRSIVSTKIRDLICFVTTRNLMSITKYREGVCIYENYDLVSCLRQL